MNSKVLSFWICLDYIAIVDHVNLFSWTLWLYRFLVQIYLPVNQISVLGHTEVVLKLLYICKDLFATENIFFLISCFIFYQWHNYISGNFKCYQVSQ